jgi:hypothetical protein
MNKIRNISQLSSLSHPQFLSFSDPEEGGKVNQEPIARIADGDMLRCDSEETSTGLLGSDLSTKSTIGNTLYAQLPLSSLEVAVWPHWDQSAWANSTDNVAVKNHHFLAHVSSEK